MALGLYLRPVSASSREECPCQRWVWLSLELWRGGELQLLSVESAFWVIKSVDRVSVLNLARMFSSPESE